MNTEFLTSLECLERLLPASRGHIDLYLTGYKLTDAEGNEYQICPGAELVGFGDLDGPSLRIGFPEWSVTINEKQFRDFVDNVRIRPTFWLPESLNS